MKSVVEWILLVGFILLIFSFATNGIPFIDLQDLPDAIIDSVSTHEKAELIPAKTMAGSEVCNDGIDVNILCVELLQYEGFRDSGIDSIIEGLEDGIRKYPLTEKELTVGWAGFGSEGGLINYLGVVLYNPKESVIEDIAEDRCKYTAVAHEYRALCIDSLIDSHNKKSEQTFLGAYMSITNIDSGHTILLKDEINDSDIKRDIRSIAVHEYFHMYQRVHDKHNMAQSMMEDYNHHEVPTDGAYWFIEGSSEYASVVTGNDNGWMNMKDHLRLMINEISYRRNHEDYKDQKGLSISNVTTRAEFDSLASDRESKGVIYGVSFLAVAYAVALSSHDSVMVDYWDDLQEYGAKESFIRNVGMSFEEFQIQFEELMQKDTSEIFEVINSPPAFVPEDAHDDSSKVEPVQVDSVEVDSTKLPDITNKTLSLSANISEGVNVAELWVYYYDLPKDSNLSAISQRLRYCLSSNKASIGFVCPELKQVGIVIPKPEKPDLRYEMFFTLTDKWTFIDNMLHVQFDVDDSIVGSGVCLVALISEGGELSMVESLGFKQRWEEISNSSNNLTEESAMEQLTDFILNYEFNYDIIGVHSIWVD